VIWIVLLLFIIFQPGLFLTIPPVGKNWWMSGKTSLTAVVIHGILFALAVGYLLPNIDGFLSRPRSGDLLMPRGVREGDTTSEAATEAAMQILAEFDKEYNSSKVSGLVRVTKFGTQIAYGTIRYVIMEWAPSKCIKSADKAFIEEYSPEACPPNGPATGIISGRIYSEVSSGITDIKVIETRSLNIRPPPPPPPPKQKAKRKAPPPPPPPPPPKVNCSGRRCLPGKKHSSTCCCCKNIVVKT
jgi:hypothetical protein